jgi:phenylpropionate dioxygenase-like ring-hydroxylating dioxygenase large terminal subunit
MAIAIVPDAKGGWAAIMSKRPHSGHPLCHKRIEKVQKKLREIYRLVDD